VKVAVGALLVLVAALGASSGRSAEPAVRELVFIRGEPATSEIYVMREDGTGLRRLTRNRASDYSPSWSPDGTRILFTSNRDGDDELFVMDADGRNVRQLTRNRRQDQTPQWSPDSEWIAFASDRARRGEPEIHVMRADGTGARRVVRTRNHTFQDSQYSPTWSPDGKRVIFSMTAAESNPELHVVGVDGKGLKRLTFTRGSIHEFGDDTMPDWSADGKTVVFVSSRQKKTSDVWVMNADGTRQRPLVRRPRSDDWNPRFSPDGMRIAFTQYPLPNGAPSIWLMNANGAGARRLGAGAEPHWSP
jgi:TolB protein